MRLRDVGSIGINAFRGGVGRRFSAVLLTLPKSDDLAGIFFLAVIDDGHDLAGVGEQNLSQSCEALLARNLIVARDDLVERHSGAVWPGPPRAEGWVRGGGG